MTAIQVLLVAAALLWLSRYLVRLKGKGGTRLVAILAAAAGISLVVFPELSTRLATLFGVTRGVDLVIYVTLVAFGFLWLHLAARIRGLEGRIVDLARRVALLGQAEIEESREPLGSTAANAGAAGSGLRKG